MMNRWNLITSLLFVLVLLLGCQMQKPDWPGYTLNALWVPKSLGDKPLYA